MKRMLILAILILIFGQLKSQSIEIGQVAEEIKKIIEWTTNDHNKPDSYGNYLSSRATWNVNYNNGQITDVIQCVENQYQVNLRMRVNYCKHYIMEQGKLAYILTQYKNVSKEKIIEVYDEMYKDTKVDKLYFDEEFKNYSKIFVDKNGYTTIEFRKSEIDKMPLSTKKEIEIKQKNISQKKKEKEVEEQRIKEIKSKYYDLREYNITMYNSIVNMVNQKIVKNLKTPDGSPRYNLINIPDFSELLKGVEKKYRYTNSLVAYYNTGHGGSTYEYLELRNIVPDSVGKDLNTSQVNAFIEVIGWTGVQPKLEIKGYTVKTEARINISIDFAKGISVIKIKDGNLEFIENTPYEDLLEKIKSKLEIEIAELNGKYLLKYEYSNVMGVENLNIKLVKN